MKTHQRKARWIATALFLGVTMTGAAPGLAADKSVSRLKVHTVFAPYDSEQEDGAIGMSVDPTSDTTRMASAAWSVDVGLQIDVSSFKKCESYPYTWVCKMPGRGNDRGTCFVSLCAALQAGAYACKPPESACEF